MESWLWSKYGHPQISSSLGQTSALTYVSVEQGGNALEQYLDMENPSLEQYLDMENPENNFSCAQIYVEVYLEKGLLSKIKFCLNGWPHLQPLDCEYFPLKCRNYHEYGHFTKNCKNKQSKHEGTTQE